MNSVKVLFTAILIMAGMVGTSQAQLISAWNAPGVDDGNAIDQEFSWLTDVETGLFVTFNITASQALAADNENGLVYASGGTDVTTYGLIDDKGTLAKVTNVSVKDSKGVALRPNQITALAYGDGVLYASIFQSKGDTSRKRGAPGGLYVINPTTGVATLIVPVAKVLSFSGMDYNEEDGLIYGVNFIGNVNDQNIYSVDPVTFELKIVNDIPASQYGQATGRFDGVAVGEGKVFLTSGLSSLPIAVYDIASNSYDLPLVNPPRKGENTSYPGGATYFPAIYGTSISAE